MNLEQLKEKCNEVVNLASLINLEYGAQNHEYDGGFMHVEGEELCPLEDQTLFLYLFPNGKKDTRNNFYFFCRGGIIHRFTARELAIFAVANLQAQYQLSRDWSEVNS